MEQSFKAIVSEIVDLSPDQWTLLEDLAFAKKAKKGDLILRADSRTRDLFFLNTGLWRGYRLIEDQEYTHHFFGAGWFATDFQSYLTGEPGKLYLQALSDSDYRVFHKKELEELYQQYPVFEKVGRVLAERAYLHMVDRLVDFQTNNLHERYQQLLRKHPNLLQEVPQKYIASYLGVAGQSLSRIKSKHSRKK